MWEQSGDVGVGVDDVAMSPSITPQNLPTQLTGLMLLSLQIRIFFCDRYTDSRGCGGAGKGGQLGLVAPLLLFVSTIGVVKS